MAKQSAEGRRVIASPRRRIRVERGSGDQPYRIISDPWEEGKPATTIALTVEQAEQVSIDLNNLKKENGNE